MKKFSGRVIAGGKLTGEAIVSHQGVNTLATFQKSALKNAKKVISSDQNNPDLYKKVLTGKILCLPKTIGSTTGGLVIQTICSMGINPSAMLFSESIDSLAASGIILARNWEDSKIIAIDNLGEKFLKYVSSGDIITIEEDGTVVVDKKEQTLSIKCGCYMSKISKLVIILTSAILTLLIICSCVVFRYKIIYDFSNIKIKSDSLSGISVMTYNIKCNDRLDFSKSGWYYRAKYVAQNIQENLATIICFQEVKIEQYDFLKNCLEEYESVILFRDKTSLTEGTPIFYKSDCFDLVSFDSFWLSDTPTEMSNTWNGAYPRVCTSVVLKEKITNKEFAVFNTHLDHLSRIQ